MSSDKGDDPDELGAGHPAEHGDEGFRKRMLGRLAKRLQNPRELGGDAMDLVGALLESSDRAKTEAVKMIAREVRAYLDELKLREDLHKLVTSHSLEVKMSISLRPLADATAPKADADAGGDDPSSGS